MSREVVLAGACRTAIGKFGGSLANIPVEQLGTIVIKEALNRAGVKPEQVDEVFMGCVLQAAQVQGLGLGLDDALRPRRPCRRGWGCTCGCGWKALAR